MKPKSATTPKNSPAFSQYSRRQFLRTAAVATAAMSFPYIGRVRGANDRINVACIGVGGKGNSDTDEAARCGGNLVALCDVDKTTLDKKAQKFPEAKLFRDFRQMFEEMGKSIDAVTVSTPDHCHAVVAATALKLGKHVFCQKPLTQTVYEARYLRNLAKEKKVATQMGNQGSADSGLRRGVEIIESGIIGAVSELHVWTNRPIWPQGRERPDHEDPVPDTLAWDVWLGPAPVRPFSRDTYHRFNWRGWFDFGCGALGDMACHTVNLPFRGLKLGYPTLVECEEASQLFPETFPKTSRIRFEFPKRDQLAALKFWWYDGNPNDKSVTALRPNPELTREIAALQGTVPTSGCLLIGDKGKIFSPSDNGGESFIMLKGEQAYRSQNVHEAAKAVPQSIPRSPGHQEEWFRMMREGTPAYSNFSIAAYLTEIILLGCIAPRVGVGKTIKWDGEKMESPNQPGAAQYVRRQNRKGWEMA
jgi:hypothetical protein